MSAPPAPAARLEILADAGELAERAAAVVEATLAAALAARGRARWVLAGGSTPRRLYRLLAERPAALDWGRVELYWGDERCVPPGDPESNYALVRATLLAGLEIPAARVHRIRGELAPEAAAREYEAVVGRALDGGPFDLVLLGLGADGHVASLFPGAPPPAGLAAPARAPAPPRARVTLTPAALASARRLVFLVSGAGKAAAVARALAPAAGGEPPPSARVRPRGGEVLWLLDRAAAAEIEER